MGISINTNIAASRASHFLASNHANLQKSLDRLSSGRRITEPADDAGGLAVAMKLNHAIQGLSGASKNIGNGISLLQVQDGVLESAGKIVSRMGELKGMSQDVTKSPSDIATYDSEFADLQVQLFQLTQTQFNGNALFNDGAQAFRNNAGVLQKDTTNYQIYTSEDGSTGSSVEVNKSLLLSGLTFDTTVVAGVTTAVVNETVWGDAHGALAGAGVAAGTFTLAVDTSDDGVVLQLGDLDSIVFTTALENVATLRAQNGGSVSRLQYAQADVESKMTNMTAAHGRIMDVDIAAESSNLAKQQILVQAAAAMTAQANTANDVALLLLR